jgi:hypothetical protein
MWMAIHRQETESRKILLSSFYYFSFCLYFSYVFILSFTSMAAYMAASSSQPDLSWYPNTTATNHMTADLNNLNLQVDKYT